MADDLPLSADFPPGDEAQWRALAERALEGAPLSRLTTKTEHGVPVKPLYRSPDWAPDASGLPGAAPFIRGGRSANERYVPWDIRQIVAHPDPAIAADQVMEALEGGVSSMELRVDAAGEHGIVARSAADIAKILKGVQLDWAAVALEAAGASSTQGIELAALLAATVSPGMKGSAPVAFNVDPIGALARTGGLPGPADEEMAQAAAFARDVASEFPKAIALRADSRPVHEAGGTEVQELAFMVASGAEYVRALMTAGVSADNACRTILFTCSVGSDYQVEMAKLRAARRMWGRIAEVFGAKGAAAGMKLQAVTSRRMLTRRDPWVNLLRNTAACFAAGVGGADIVTVRTFTDAMGLPGKLARRLARNTQVIAQEESNLGKVIDAPGGSWAIERLGDDLANAAWTLFQQVEREGGLVKALQLGGFQTGVASARAARLAAAAKRKELITGVTDFPLIGEDMPSIEVVNLPNIVRRAAEASGRAPDGRSWSSLKAAASDKATLADLSRTSDEGAEAEPLWPIRLAEPFERLRDLADERTAAGRAPKVFMAAVGPLAEHSARLQFAQNFFAAGGIGADLATGDCTALAKAAKASGCALACICGSDKRYAEEAPTTARALKDAGVARLYLAGKPGDREKELRDAGVDEFIHAGVDVLASLELAHAELGLPR
ncbi:MAG TPA: methylmalonyl-CoA mutase family protein [Hyphomonadaceae bacterium]|nr:methylmalonyl-CoA mutase family protein [Hyphomonadaceae bacterium]